MIDYLLAYGMWLIVAIIAMKIIKDSIKPR